MLLLLVALESSYRDERNGLSAVDDDIIKRISENDNAAFRILYEATEKPLFGVALSILKDRYDAEDALHDTYIKLKSCAHLYEGRGKPMAWLFTITRNLCLMKLREKSRYAELGRLEDDISFSCVTDHDGRLVLESAMNGLGEDERQIVMLHAVSGLRHREIAQLLELPLSTVLSKYNRAIKKLKNILNAPDAGIRTAAG